MSIEQRQVAHFDNLIRMSRALGFQDDVEHWEAQKAAYIAEMSEPSVSGSGTTPEQGSE